MRVLLLGGAGRFGAFTARHLAAAHIVSEVAVAGRNQDALTRAAAEFGDKARTIQVDIHEQNRLASVAADYDIVVNAAGPEWEVLLPGLGGAIASGTNYCDLGAHGPTAERQLELDDAAKQRDIVALIGMGLDPGLSNLLAAHAYRQLDRAEEVQLRVHFALPFDLLLEDIDRVRKGHVDPSLQLILNIAKGPVRLYRDGHWTDVDPRAHPVEITSPESETVTAYPMGMPEALTLPRYLPGVRSVSCLLGLSPPQVSELFLREAERISRGEATAKEATRSFLETLGTDPHRWFARPAGPTLRPGWRMWIVAIGWKDGKRARYACWPLRLPHSTIISLTVGILRILRGEVSARGVLPPEACFEPMRFFEEAAQYAREEDRNKPLLGESLEWLS